MNKNFLNVFLFFIGIFCFTVFLFSNSVLTANDTCFSFLYGGIKFVKTLYYGSWLMWVMNTLFYVIPYKLNINLQDWFLSAGVFFKSLVITSVFIYVYKILRLKFKKQDSTIITVLLYVLFFFLNSKIGFIDFIINERFFRFIIPSFLMEIFIYYFYLLIKGEKINTDLLMVYAVFLAASSETAAIILIFSVLIIVVVKKKYINILLMLISGFICLITTKGFNMYTLNENFGININDMYSFLVMFLIMFISFIIPKKCNIKIYYLVILILLVPFINSCILLKNTFLNIKDYTYARDKIRMFYEYKNMKPVMPEFARYRMFEAARLKDRIDIEKNIYIKEFNQEEYVQTLMNRDYYPILYKAEINGEWEINENAVDIFKARGGSLKEISKGRYKFRNIENKEFVLKNKGK